MKNLVLAFIGLALSATLSANTQQKISVAQQTAKEQTAKLKMELDLSDKQAVKTYSVIFNAASELYDFKNEEKSVFQTKLMKVQHDTSNEFKSFLSEEQLKQYIEIVAEANKNNKTVFYSI